MNFIENIQTLSQLDTGSYKKELTEFDAEACIVEVVQMFHY